MGLTLGLVAGAFGGWVDGLIMRLVDIMLAIPSLLLAIGIAALLGPRLLSVMIAIAVVNVPIFARLLRGTMLAQRNSDHVLAARALGVKPQAIVFRHMLPNAMGPVIVQATLVLAVAIIDAAALSFLGLGIPPPAATWGNILAEGRERLFVAPWIANLSGLAIVLLVWGVNILGNGLRERFDPRE